MLEQHIEKVAPRREITCTKFKYIFVQKIIDKNYFIIFILNYLIKISNLLLLKTDYDYSSLVKIF